MDRDDGKSSVALKAILAVNRMEVNQRALAAMLQPLRRRVITAKSEEEALAAASSERPALLLLDITSEADGFDAVARLRASSRLDQTPIILLTRGQPGRDALNASQRGGLVDYVRKPVPPELLRSKIAALLSFEAPEAIVRRNEVALAAKDRAIAILAHDLQNPISALAIATEVLAQGGRDDRFRDRVQNVSRIVAHVNDLIRDLTEYARARQGRFHVAEAPIDVGELCAAVVADFVQIHPTAKIALRCRGDLKGSWDRTRLSRALRNLIQNAVRHGAGEVLVSASGRRAGVQIAVHNHGAPIPAEVLPKIFHPFVRGRRHGQGLGLGLFIVKQVAAAHGGDVGVRSSAQRGTTFALRLPRLGREVGAPQAEDQPAAPAPLRSERRLLARRGGADGSSVPAVPVGRLPAETPALAGRVRLRAGTR